MIVFNQTTKISWSIAENWLDWEANILIPEILSTGLFSDFKIFRLLEQDDEEGPTYVIQFFTEKLNKYHTYLRDYASIHMEKAMQKWGDQFISFKTVMEHIR
ncbi:MAG TPA: DUF4286 family protein [Puia sp.]|nr:DUF4286 family protein [Puia sp.]